MQPSKGMNGADRDNEWRINTQSYLSDWEKIEIIPGKKLLS